MAPAISKLALVAGGAAAAAIVAYLALSGGKKKQKKTAPAPIERKAVTSDSGKEVGKAVFAWPESGSVPVVQFDCVYRFAGEEVPMNMRHPSDGYLSFVMSWTTRSDGDLNVEWSRFRIETTPSPELEVVQRIVISKTGQFKRVDNIDALVKVAIDSAVSEIDPEQRENPMLQQHFAMMVPRMKEQITEELKSTWDSIVGTWVHPSAASSDLIVEEPSDEELRTFSTRAEGRPLFCHRVQSDTPTEELKAQVLAKLAQGMVQPDQVAFEAAKDFTELEAILEPENVRVHAASYRKMHTLKFSVAGERINRTELLVRRFIVLWGQQPAAWRDNEDTKKVVKDQYEAFCERCEGHLAESGAAEK